MIGLPNLISVKVFSVFPEYFISISIIYILIVSVLITRNVYGLMLQKALSESIALILLMTCYLIFNDDLIDLNFLSFNFSIISDYLAFSIKFILCFFSALYFLLIADSLKEQKLTSFEYVLIILFAILGLMLMCSSNDLLTAYLAIELSSLAFYILAAFKKTSSYSIESGVTYFITGAVSSGFFLLGSSFLYGHCGSIDFATFWLLKGGPANVYHDFGITEFAPIINEMLEGTDSTFSWKPEWNPYHHYLYDFNTHRESIQYFFPASKITETNKYIDLNTNWKVDVQFVELGLILIFFSLFIKLATAPFHLWSLDVYEGSPTSSTFFFAAISKLTTFVLLIRLTGSLISPLNIHYEPTCYFFPLIGGALSVFVGSFGGLRQRRFKTLLAYSSTSHMGYALLAFSTASIVGNQMLIFYLIIYMTSSLCVWSIITLLRLKTKTFSNKYNKELSDFALLKKSNPALALSLALTMFSIAGIPPLIGFFAKMSVFLTAVDATYYFIALLIIICSVVSTFYYIRVIKILYFENLLVGKLYYPINNSKTIILSILIFLLVFLFINPNLLYLFTYKIFMN